MDLIIECSGRIHCLYGEALDLRLLGRVTICRASHVEPDGEGGWWADLFPVHGPRLGPFVERSAALVAEQRWLETNWLDREDPFGPPSEGGTSHADRSAASSTTAARCSQGRVGRRSSIIAKIEQVIKEALSSQFAQQRVKLVPGQRGLR
jgi:hypothetical protein